jgi:hypothetical protein
MAHRRTVIQSANDISVLVMEQCRGEVTPRIHRLQAAHLILGEFAEMADRIERSLHDHGEVTPTCFRYLRENLRDLANNVVGSLGMPTSEAATALVAEEKNRVTAW